MTTRVKTFDKIAPQGLSLFGPAYTVSVDEAQTGITDKTVSFISIKAEKLQ
jgi:AAA+ superfamily predicted ATPase